MSTFNRGDRVRLVRISDPYTRLRPGDLGTVTFTDSLDTIGVRWDSGSALGIVEEAGDVIVAEKAPAGQEALDGPETG